MGDVPAWFQVVGGTAQLGQAIWAHRVTRADHLREEILRESGSSLDELAQRIAEEPALGDVLLNALESAMRSASSQKRKMLARVVAAAFTSDDVDLDEFTILQRTASLVEEVDAAVLMQIAQSNGSARYEHSVPGCVLLSDIATAVPDGVDDSVLTPVLTHLVGLGLLVDHAASTYDNTAKWGVSPYGFRFLHFLPLDRQLFDQSVLATTWFGTKLTVYNLGWGDLVVHSVSATCDGKANGGNYPTAAVRLAAGRSLEIGVDDEIPRGGGLRVVVEWTDPLGGRQVHEHLHWKH